MEHVSDAAMAAAVAHLTAIGFQPEADLVAEVFDNRTIELRRGRLIVSLIRERGPVSLTIRRPADGFDAELDLWVACLDGRAPELIAAPLSAQLDALIARLAELDHLIDVVDPVVLVDCQRAAAAWRADQLFRRR